MTCFVCGKDVHESDDYEWFGMDGDKIHKKCAPNKDKVMSFIDKLTEKQFSDYLLGKTVC